jgi:GAF domain-containing protein
VTLSEESLLELSALPALVLEQDDLVSTLEEVARVTVRALPAASGASLTTFEQGRPATTAASDPWARGLDELQYVESEGPCLDCWRTGVVFRVRDLAEDARWPSYGPRAAAKGARSSLSLPLSAEGDRVGALNVYAEEVDAFSSDAVSVAQVIAAHAGLASRVAAAYFGHRDLAAQLREAMRSRAVIEQAKGVLIATLGVDAAGALDVLRTVSQQRNTKLRELAEHVVEHRGLDDRG